jgi:hypothetical protein
MRKPMSYDNNDWFYTTSKVWPSDTTAASDNFLTYDSIAMSNNMSYKVTLPTWKIEKNPEEQVPPEGIFPGYLAQEMLVYYPRGSKEYIKDNANQNPGILSFINIRDLLARFFVGTYFNLERVNNWRGKCIGITSMLYPGGNYGYSGNHMPMFDYDGNVKKKIRKDVASLQEKYGLGDAWVYRTKKGYHVYFFCDSVSYENYMEMIQGSDCCTGFKGQTKNAGFSILRVSAKYTNFDIELEYVLRSKNGSGAKRPLKKALVVQELISLGQQCGTHFASLYPQWARFVEDSKEWRAPSKPKTRRARRKSSSKAPLTPEEILHMKEELNDKQRVAPAFPPPHTTLIDPIKHSFADMEEAERRYMEESLSKRRLTDAEIKRMYSPPHKIVPVATEPRWMEDDEYGGYDETIDDDSF